MIKINEKERDYLLGKGFKFGDDLHRTFSHHKHYYVTERPKLLNILNSYRKSVTIVIDEKM